MAYPELKRNIRNKGMRQEFVAKQLGISGKVLCDRLRGRSEWKAAEIFKLRDILGLSWKDTERIFFAKVVE